MVWRRPILPTLRYTSLTRPACKAVLALGKRVPHWEHTDDIALIRSTLRMNEEFNDVCPIFYSSTFEVWNELY
jgi:hypothetical protein